MPPPHTHTKDSFLISFGPKSDVTLLSLKYVQEMGLFYIKKSGLISRKWRNRTELMAGAPHLAFAHKHTRGEGRKRKM